MSQPTDRLFQLTEFFIRNNFPPEVAAEKAQKQLAEERAFELEIRKMEHAERMRAAAPAVGPQVGPGLATENIALGVEYRRYDLHWDELGLKTKVIKLMFVEALKGSVERKRAPDTTRFYCEILVYGKLGRILKLESELRRFFPQAALSGIVLTSEEFVQLDANILVKLVKTDSDFHRENSSGGTNEFIYDQRDIERLGGEASWADYVTVTPSVKSFWGRVLGYEGLEGLLRDVLKGYTGVGGTQKVLIVSIGDKPPRIVKINDDTTTWEFLDEMTDQVVSRVEVVMNGINVVVDNPTLLSHKDHIVVYLD